MARTAKARVDIEVRDRGTQNVSRVRRAFSGLASFISSRLVFTLGDVTRLFSGLGRALLSGVAAADRQEQALAKLNAAMRAAGDASAAASQAAQDFASELQSSANIADEVVLSNLALAKSFVGTNEAAQELVSAAADFAQAAGIDFTEALRRLGRATRGSTEDVAKFVPEILDLTTAQLAAGEATRLIAQRFDGMAAAAANTSAGIRQGLALALGDLAERLGQSVTESAKLNTALKGTTGIIQGLNKAASDGESRFGTFAALFVRFGNAVLTAGQSEREFADALDAAAEAARQAAGSQERYNEDLRIAAADVSTLTGAEKKRRATLESLAKGLGTLEAAVESLNEAEARSIRITKELAAADEAFAASLEALGITLERDANKSILENNELLEEAERRYRNGEISANDLRNAQKLLTDANRELREGISGVSEETAVLGIQSRRTATDQRELAASSGVAASAADGMRLSLERTRETLRAVSDQVVTTGRQFDELAASAGRAAAVNAALAGGGRLELGGTRIRFRGGSRLVRPPQGTRSFGGDRDLFNFSTLDQFRN